MKSSLALIVTAFFTFGIVCTVHGQTFDATNDGSDGVMNIAANTTLDLPPDGIFRCTTITVAPNATLRFNRNVANSPVLLLATGDILIQGSIVIDGSNSVGAIPGSGGPGGFDGGFGGSGKDKPASEGGDGHGPGRGRAVTAPLNLQSGVFAEPSLGNSNIYGNALLIPLVGGSGGAGYRGNPGYGGGGGGGAILIASASRITVSGRVSARGGNAQYGGGSGGAIRLLAPVVAGTGILDARGQQFGSAGRIRIDCTDRLSYRNLALNGVSSRGNRMQVYPAATPQLRFVEAAGQAIAEDAGAAVMVTLPAGAPTEQAIKLRGLGFAGEVPVRVAVIPEHDASTTYDLLLNANATPAELTLNVTLIPGEPTRIEAWAK